MPRAHGTQRYRCYCVNCRQMFKARRADARTCSDRCRKAWNRLMGGSVTKKPNGPEVFRVLLNGKHIASKGTREEAERLVAQWLEEWDGEFEIVPHVARQKRDARI